MKKASKRAQLLQRLGGYTQQVRSRAPAELTKPKEDEDREGLGKRTFEGVTHSSKGSGATIEDQYHGA